MPSTPDTSVSSPANTRNRCDDHLSLLVILMINKTWKGEILKKWLNRQERSNTYLTHVCRMWQSIEKLVKIEKEGQREKKELSASTVAFISCTDRLR